MATQDRNSPGLPDTLRSQFAQLAARCRKVGTVTGLNLALVLVFSSWLALFLSDRFWNTPPWLRLGLAAIGWLAVGRAVVHWWRWTFRPPSLRALAVLVQRRYPRLGDRLLGIVELADEKTRPAQFSPALYRAAIQQVAAETQAYDFAATVDSTPLRRSTQLLFGTCALVLGVALLSIPAATRTFRRWIAPTAAVPRYSLVQLSGLPEERIVPHGEPFTLSCRIEYRSWWKPRRASGRIEGQSAIPATAFSDQLTFQVPPLMASSFLSVRLGDASAQVRIIPTHRPSLTGLNAEIALPDYLHYPVMRESVEGGSLTVVEGSRVVLQGQTSRRLEEAYAELAGEPGRALAVRTNTFASDPLALDESSEIALRWRDELGLTNAAPWRLQLRSRKDSPATPELAELVKDTAILEGEVLELRMSGRDDFGVRELGVAWQVLTESAPTNNAPEPRLTLQASSPREQRLEETFQFSPANFGIPPDSIVELRGFALDFLPDREPSWTPVYRLHVLGNEQHAELVRQNLESLLSRLEEVTRLEEQVSATTRELQEQPAEQLKAKSAEERIAKAQEAQSQNAAHLEQLAKEGVKTLREATRNPTFSDDTLRQWAENLRQMQNLSQGKMGEIDQALKSARQDAESRPENLAEAAKKENEVLESLEELQRQINKGLDQLQAMTLAQRLRKVSFDEKEIAGRLQKIVPETIGMLPNELPGHFKTAEANLAKDQNEVQKDATTLHSELGRFFERTQKEAYGQVNKEMSESRVGDELDRLRGLIQENIAMESIQSLGGWAQRLNAWADLLEPKSEGNDGGGGGGGGDGGSGDDSLIRELLGLLRLRDRQLNLRRRTELVDKRKVEASEYLQSAKSLAEAQGKVGEEMRELQGENPVPALEFPLQDIVDSMDAVGNLLNKPQTDRTTAQAHSKTIELLSDVINLINEQQQRKNNSQSESRSPTAEEMAFLMQMLSMQNAAVPGMGVNPNQRGSQAGGTTDRVAGPAQGDPSGGTGEGRAVNRASGRGTALPAEFRDALEKYFRAVEKLEQKP